MGISKRLAKFRTVHGNCFHQHHTQDQMLPQSDAHINEPIQTLWSPESMLFLTNKNLVAYQVRVLGYRQQRLIWADKWEKEFVQKMLPGRKITQWILKSYGKFLKSRMFVIGKAQITYYKVLVTQSCPTHCDPVDYTYSPSGSSVHEILQARILEWVAILFSRGSTWPKDWTRVSCIAGRFFTTWATRKATYYKDYLQKGKKHILTWKWSGSEHILTK